MLKAHLDVLEEILLTTSKVVDSAGHNIHKGTPREYFIRNFLRVHLTENVGIGSGEVIDYESRPGQKRNQLDLILYNQAFPKLDLGGGINSYLCESLIAHLEIKSIVNKAALKEAVKAARSLKALKRNSRHQYSRISSYVVGYSGPSSMSRINTWLSEIHEEESIELFNLPLDAESRIRISSPSVDVVIILGIGFLYFDTSPIGFIKDEQRESDPDLRWVWVEDKRGSLLFLFLHLTMMVGSALGQPIHLGDYLRNVSHDSLFWSNGGKSPRKNRSSR